MGLMMGRCLDSMVLISSFMLPAVEIASIVALRVEALLPLTPAVAVPMAAGEAPCTGRWVVFEEDIFFEKYGRWKRKDVG
jgi:hypothetical protein